ncbi:SulP family inorganic anion transporter [Botrimarina sp.]|uniref:SulP family inorganic anion transporter n=1 Tax=Botrimarina sp. TaxID=2795802 RepID=UPI0032EC9B41
MASVPVGNDSERLGWGQAIKSDLPASIIVFLVALPLCIGIAEASGAEPAQGLITGIIGGLLVALISGSPLQVSGPAAGLFVLVAQVIEELGPLALGVVVLGAGLIQVGAALLKFGNYFRAVSPAVIQGMLSGIGVLILASEFHAMVDDHDAAVPWLDAGYPKGIANLLSIPKSLELGLVPLDGSPHHVSAALGVGTIIVLVLWNFLPIKSLRIVPGAVIAVTLAAGVTRIMGWEDTITHVIVPDNLLDDVVLPTAWPVAGLAWGAVLVAAIEIALVASAETMLCCAAVDQMQSKVRTKYDKELLAQGVGNSLCGLVGALPMTGVIVRSSANVQAGGQTRLSAWLHGLWLLMFVAALPWVLNYIPRASLAAVLVYTGWKLINPKGVYRLWSVSRPDGIICLITLALVVGVDLLTGVLVGVACTAARLLYTFARLDVDLVEVPEAGRTDLHLRGAATFLALPKLTEALDRVSPNTELHVSLQNVTYVDHSCLEQFINWEKQHEATGGKLVIDWDDLTATFRDAGKNLKNNSESAGATVGGASR